MDRFDYYNYYKEDYHKELERMARIRSSTQIPIGITLVLLTGLDYLVRQSFEVPIGFPMVIHRIFVVILAFSLLFAIYRLVAAYWGYRFKMTPSAKELEDYRAELQKHYGPYQDTDIHVDNAFREYLVEKFVECNTRNYWVNAKKSSHLHAATRWIIVAIISAFIAVIPTRIPDLSWVSERVSEVKEVIFRDVEGREQRANPSSPASGPPGKGIPRGRFTEGTPAPSTETNAESHRE